MTLIWLAISKPKRGGAAYRKIISTHQCGIGTSAPAKASSLEIKETRRNRRVSLVAPARFVPKSDARIVQEMRLAA